MKIFLSRLGKTIELFFQGRGFIDIFLIFGEYFRRFFSYPRKGAVLYVSAGVGASGLYRCFNQAEELRKNNIKSSVVVQGSPFFSKKLVSKFSVFIIQFRTIFDSKMKEFIEEIKKQEKKIIFEADDLLFDKEYYSQASYFEKVGQLEKKAFSNYQKGMGEEILKDNYVKTCVVSTDFIAKELRKREKEAFISVNKISQSDWRLCEKIIKKQQRQKKKKITLGYFSGTKSHDRDFKTITMALVHLLEKYQDLELVLMGPLGIDQKLEKFFSRIKFIPFSSRKKYFEELAKVEINLAPLEIGNPFCEAKSELKFIEAGALAKPTVAAATQTFSKAIVDGEDGFLARNGAEWEDKISKLIENEDRRKNMGKKAKKKILEKYTTFNAQNVDFYEKIKSWSRT